MVTTHINPRFIASSILLIIFTLFMVTGLAGAQIIDEDICDAAQNGTPAVCEDAWTDQTASDNILVGPDGMITRVSQVLVWMSGALAAILIIIAGLMFIFSSGNSESAGRARRTVLYAVIGVIVAVVGQGIVTFVLEKL